MLFPDIGHSPRCIFMAGNHTMDKDLQQEQSVLREDTNYFTIGKTTYEISSVFSGKSTLLDLVKASLERSAQQALRTMKNP